MRVNEYLHKNGQLYKITTGERGKQLSAGAKYSRGETLLDVYGRCSQAKHQAYINCKNRCDEMQGMNFRITSANSNFFSIAYEVEDDITGVLVTVIDTGRNDYYVYY